MRNIYIYIYIYIYAAFLLKNGELCGRQLVTCAASFDSARGCAPSAVRRLRGRVQCVGSQTFGLACSFAPRWHFHFCEWSQLICENWNQKNRCLFELCTFCLCEHTTSLTPYSMHLGTAKYIIFFRLSIIYYFQIMTIYQWSHLLPTDPCSYNERERNRPKLNQSS